MARKDQPFSGTLSTDGKTVFGEYTLAGYTLPFSMNRTGAAEIIVPEKSAPIARQLEGRWSGVLNAGGKTMRRNLTMANQPDGTATASIVSLDEGELELPITVAQAASTVTINISITGAAYSGVVNADGTELAGTFTQRTLVMLTFRAVRLARAPCTPTLYRRDRRIAENTWCSAIFAALRFNVRSGNRKPRYETARAPSTPRWRLNVRGRRNAA